ncbi:MAG: phosphate signaling complex protein PhoU [Gammaproteobacteria bacterium]|jgi:phosphate transport system protein|nr:MAG: phosphate signaling complex protein PhoU [Gammaproteobacteria bacterium]
MNRHISEQYDLELDSARSLLLQMGGLVEQQLQQACQALYSHDLELAEKVRAGDAAINQLEVDIDDLCAQIIARRQPAATDLRTLISVMKASTDLERIGDEAERIAKMAQKIANLEQPADHYGDIREMASMVHTMLADALDAFARLSAEGAVQVIDADEAVDDAYDEIVKEKGAAMKSDPDSIELSLTILWVARALERCGDHAKNLCEYIVYLVKGTDVRHADASAAVTDS